jgi:NAD(P)-dependent dehydrogenase (short-subunit alcohol dehydrogenase family)
MAGPLAGQVALVAGATRGAGRGIALELAAAGAFVWCTGRSTADAPATPGRPETVDETAELIRAAGGDAAAVRCDHTQEIGVATVGDRIRAESGRLDILVNDIWGGDALIDWGAKFWTLDIGAVRTLTDRAVLSHLITARHLAPLMIEGGRGLIVEVTDGELPGYRGQLLYDFVKAAVIRLAYAMAWDLVGTGVTALALSPGFLRSEAVLESLGVTEANWRDGVAKSHDFAYSETPRYIGRAIVALAADPNIAAKAGRAFFVDDLAPEYGFSDVDGAQPHFWRNMDAWLEPHLDGEGKLDPNVRWIAAARYAQIHLSADRRDLAQRLAKRLGLSDLPPGLSPA